MKPPEARRIWKDVRDAVVHDGTVPLSDAVQWTDERLAQAWDLFSIPHRVEWLIDLRLHEELIFRLAYRVAAGCPPVHASECAEVIAKLEQERVYPGSVDLPALRHHLNYTPHIPRIAGWSTFKEVTWVLDPISRMPGTPIGDRNFVVENLWMRLKRAMDGSRELPPEFATEEIVKAMGPPTLQQIVAAAEAWGPPVRR